MIPAMKYPSILVVFAFLFIVLSSCDAISEPQTLTRTTITATSSNQLHAEPDWGVQTKTADCQAQGSLQDFACTPGAIFPKATKSDICTPGYAKSVRNVSQSTKNKVYAAYGVKKRLPGQYEVDHLVSLQLGGSNDIANLWPEASEPKPGFHEKDQVENFLHDEICDGKISLREAQIEIATDWLQVYKRIPANTSSSDIDTP
jgi:hypothetical protein